MSDMAQERDCLFIGAIVLRQVHATSMVLFVIRFRGYNICLFSFKLNFVKGCNIEF